MALSFVVGILFLGATLAALPIPSAEAATTVDISIHNLAFNPSVVSIAVGDTVTWTNNDTITHTVTSDVLGKFDSMDIPPGGSFSQTFTTAGTFGYHCSIHTYMMGTVNVGGATTSSATTTSSTTSVASSASTTSTSIRTKSYTTSTHPTTTSTTSQSSSTSGATIASTTLQITSSTVPPSSTSTDMANNGGGIPEFPFQAVTAGVITLLLLISYLVVRRDLKETPQGPQPGG